jgi:hypothetical protein
MAAMAAMAAMAGNGDADTAILVGPIEWRKRLPA